MPLVVIRAPIQLVGRPWPDGARVDSGWNRRSTSGGAPARPAQAARWLTDRLADGPAEAAPSGLGILEGGTTTGSSRPRLWH